MPIQQEIQLSTKVSIYKYFKQSAGLLTISHALLGTSFYLPEVCQWIRLHSASTKHYPSMFQSSVLWHEYWSWTVILSDHSVESWPQHQDEILNKLMSPLIAFMSTICHQGVSPLLFQNGSDLISYNRTYLVMPSQQDSTENLTRLH